ncbi:MAG: hypothetical protein K9N51_05300 [Candidatus Pacebacteria bacterium]|nr:hypothetical protein [Candidatus Paceibacterota bacterium]
MFGPVLHNFSWQRPADRDGPRRLVVVDLGVDSTDVVTVSRVNGRLEWLAGASLAKAGDDLHATAEQLTAELKEHCADTPYVSILTGGRGGIVRLLTFPGQPARSETLTQHVQQTLGVGADYAVLQQVVRRMNEGEDAEYSVLAAALPYEEIDILEDIVVNAGLTPVTLVAEGIAAANLAEAEPEKLPEEGAVGFLRIRGSTSLLLLYDGNDLALARQFRVGADAIIESLMSAFDLDYETARKLFNSGSFDFSGNISGDVSSWLHQISISLDFIERRYGHRAEPLYLLGPGQGTNVLCDVFSEAAGRKIEPWDVLGSLGGLEAPPGLAQSSETYALALCEAVRIMNRGLENEA